MNSFSLQSPDTRLKVLMVIPSFYPLVGGAEKQLEGLSESLLDFGIDPVVLARKVNGARSKERLKGFDVIRLPGIFYPIPFLLSLFMFCIMRRHSYRIIHVHTLNSPFWACVLIGILLGKPVLVKITRSGIGSQLDFYQARWYRRVILRFFMRHVQVIVAITKDIQDTLMSLGIPDDRIVLIPNGVKARFNCDADSYPKLCGNVVTCIYVGRLIPRKGLEVLLQAWSDAGPPDNARLIIIGGGSDSDKLKKIARDLSIYDTVCFLGELSQEDVFNWMSKSDIFILPSESEGMSNALLEALSHGLPVIARDIEANFGLVDHGKNGFLFHGLQDLRDYLKVMISDKDVRGSFGKDSIRRVSEKFSFEKIAASYASLYHKLLSSD